MAKNQAVWLKEKGAQLVVEDAPMWTPKSGEVLVKVASAAVNPVDWAQQVIGLLVSSYPYILGCDLAGTIEAVGEGVTEFKKGDRVLAFAGLEKEYRGFQKYALASSHNTTPLPANVSFDEGASLPLVLATAVHGLYGAGMLGLARPSSAGPDPALKGKKVLVWSGASTVGMCAVQLAAHAGYTVVSTASPQNQELVRSLGAVKVFDHYDPDVVAKIHAEFGKDWVGAYDAAGRPPVSLQKCAEVITRGFVASSGVPPQGLVLPEGVSTKFVQAMKLRQGEEHLAKWIFHEYLPKALADGTFRAPPLQVMHGLNKVQEAINVVHQGVSGKKVVVRVDDL